MDEIRVIQYLPERDGEIPVDEREVWRYAGYFGIPENADRELRGIYEDALKAALGAATYRVSMRRFPILWENGMPLLPFPSESKGLAKVLEGCCEGVMFAATVGMGIDRLIQRTQRTDTPKALMMQAIGAERVEALCDRFCRDQRDLAEKEGLAVTRRYSPGYSDLPLETQRDFMRLLEMDRRLGISLGESLLMTPSKSVTAVFGLRPFGKGEESNKHKCSECDKLDCDFRQE